MSGEVNGRPLRRASSRERTGRASNARRCVNQAHGKSSVLRDPSSAAFWGGGAHYEAGVAAVAVQDVRLGDRQRTPVLASDTVLSDATVGAAFVHTRRLHNT